MTQQQQRRLPLSVIGGFLGAGKTTLLNRWLRESRGQRIAVLVNDFGELNIDAELIAAASGDAIALTNGCVCCQIGDDLTRALIQVLESGTSFDAVVIEASGVSDPWRVAQLGLADPGLALNGVIVLVDAGAALEQSRDPLLADTLERQLRAADLIVVNKIDSGTPEETARVREWVATVAGKTPQLETTQARVPLALLAGLALPEGRASHPEGEHDWGHDGHSSALDHDHGELFDTWSCRPRQIFSASSLRKWLGDTPAGLLRLKGLVRTGTAEWSEIQFAGKHGSLRRAVAPAGGAAVVAIGLRGQLPADALSEIFEPVKA